MIKIFYVLLHLGNFLKWIRDSGRDEESDEDRGDWHMMLNFMFKMFHY